MKRTLAVVSCLVLVTAAIAGAATAADRSALADFEPREYDVSAGETAEVALTIQVASVHDTEAVKSIEYSLVYDPDVLSVVDVEQGPWLQDGDETNVSFETDVDTDEGRLTVEQAREPPAGGVTGSGTTAIVTFEAASDASPSSAVVQYDEYSAQMLEYPLPVLHQRTEATIHVDGGGEERPPAVDEDGNDDSPEIITPESSTESDGATGDGSTEDAPAEGDSSGNGPADSDVDDQPGFGVVIAGLSLLSVAAIRLIRQTA